VNRLRLVWGATEIECRHDADGIKSSSKMTASIETDLFANRVRLKELRVAHRDLDTTIEQLISDPAIDQIRIKRLKKRRLALKDTIVRLESDLIPNLNA
jgi:hypothetical protein